MSKKFLTSLTIIGTLVAFGASIIPESILAADATDNERWIHAYELLTEDTVVNGADLITHSEEDRLALKNALLDLKTPDDHIEENEYHFKIWANGCGTINIDDYDPYEPGRSVGTDIQNLQEHTDIRYYPVSFPCHAGDSLDEVLEILGLEREMLQKNETIEISGSDMLESVFIRSYTTNELDDICFKRKDNIIISLGFHSVNSSEIHIENELCAVRFTDYADYSEKKEEMLSDLDEEASSAYPWNSNKKMQEGDIVTFGVYEQDNDLNNGPEDLMWHVAYADENEVLLVCNRGLDFVDYMNDASHDISWSESTIRDWLRTEFYTQAFSQEEQGVILTKTLETKGNSKDDIETSEDTVFILSPEELMEYLDSSQRPVLISDYAEAKCHSNTITMCGTYLRSYNSGIGTVDGMDQYGECRVYFCNDPMGYHPPVAVRPAVWINQADSTDPISQALQWIKKMFNA